MAKKTLLTEGEFKKFMKLARLEPLAGEKLSEMYGSGRPGMRDDKPGMRNPGMREPGMRDEEEEDELDEELSALFEEEDEMPDMGGEEETAMEPVGDEPMGDDEMPDVELADDEMGGGDMGDLRGQIEDALEKAKKIEKKEIFIIGGGQIYKQSLEFANKLYITEVDTIFDDADTFFPEINNEDYEVELISQHKKDEKHKFDFQIKLYSKL